MKCPVTVSSQLPFAPIAARASCRTIQRRSTNRVRECSVKLLANPMADKLEEVAVAIARICNEKGQELASKCEMQAPAIPWQAFEREAKAAIEAMRKPTDAMLQAFYAVPSTEGGVWDAVIDAALEGKND